MPLNLNAMNAPTAHGHTPTGELHPLKADEATPTHSPASGTSAASHTHYTAHSDSKARAPHNAVPAPAHRRNRADTVEHRDHNGAPNHTPRQDKFTRQEVRGKHSRLTSLAPAP
ncbi:hypothetical protein ILYODFUR_010413, partial [Ilyodon furcidens]